MAEATEIEDVARELFAKADPTGIWAQEDEITRIYYLRQAQQHLAAKRYTAESV